MDTMPPTNGEYVIQPYSVFGNGMAQKATLYADWDCYFGDTDFWSDILTGTRYKVTYENNQQVLCVEALRDSNVDLHKVRTVDIKKDIFAESILLKFNNLAAVIAIPDLLTPGTNDKTCKIPMKIAFCNVKFFSIFLSILNLSLIKSNMPNKKVVQAITSKFLIFSITPKFIKI